jgi:orotate phosphoribosyltransferase
MDPEMSEVSEVSEVSELACPARGHFDMGTGYHGDLWLDLDSLFLRPGQVRPHAVSLASQLRSYRLDGVCGPLTGGAFLAQQLAEILGVAFLPAYRDAGPSAQPASYRLPRSLRGRIGGWRIAVVDDAVNAGTAVQASLDEVRDAAAVPVAVAALLALGRAAAFTAETHLLPFYTVATMTSRAWPSQSCLLCASNIPLDRPDS